MSSRKRTRRRWFIATGLALVVALVAVYTTLTNPARLRARVFAALQKLPVRGIDIAEVTYSPWAGLELSDVTIDRPSSDARRRVAGTSELPRFLRVGSARIRCGLGGLLVGRVYPSDIELDDVAAVVVCEPPGNAGEPTAASADADLRLISEFLRNAPDPLPDLTISQIDLQLLTIERDRPQLLRRTLLHATGHATDTGYDLRVDHRPPRDEALAALRWNRRSDVLTVALDWVDLKTAARFLPPRAADELARFDLAGRAHLDTLELRLNDTHTHNSPDFSHAAIPWGQLGAVSLSLADLRCVLPLEGDSASSGGSDATRPADCFLQVADAAGTLTYAPSNSPEPSAWELTLRGLLRNAPIAGSLRVEAAALRRAWAAQTATKAEESALAACTLDDVLRAELSVDGLELPTAETFPGFVNSPHLTSPVVAAFQDYRPHGPVNLRLRILPRGTQDPDGTPLTGAARFEGEIEPRGAGCRYRHFPYEFEDAAGTIRLSRGRILIDHLCGRHGGGRACAAGVVNDSHSWSGVDLQFLGQGIALDDALYAALPGQYHRLWQQAAPFGICDIVTHIRRTEGSAETGPLAADVQVDAHLLAGSVALGADRRLDHADGWLTIDNGLVQVRNLHGYDGEAAVQLDGEVRLADGAPRADLRVAISGLPVLQNAALPFASAASPPRISLTGRADVIGRAFDAGAGGGREQNLAVHITEGVLHGLDPQRGWDVTDGWIRVQNEARQILSLTCAQGAARLDVAGTLPSAAHSGSPLALLLQANTPAIEDLGPQFLPGDWARRVADLGLAGAGAVIVRLHPDGDDPTTTRQAATIAVRAARMNARPFPLELRNLDGNLALSPGRFQLHQATAEWGENGHVLVQQPHEGTWDSGQLDATFDIAARNLRFCPALLAALPQPAARLLDKLAARGDFDALLNTVQFSGGEELAWQLEGRLPLRDIALRLGLDLRVAEGELSGVCSVAANHEVTLDTTFHVARGQIADRPIADWDGQLRHTAGEPWVLLSNIHGRLCDGTAQGLLRINSESSEYELALTLYDVSVDQMLPRPKDQPEHPRAGRLDGEIWLRGRGQDTGSRQGGGNLRITGVSFLQTPVLSSVFTAFRRLQRPAPSDIVQRARVRFLWEGRELRLERIAIASEDLRLVGEGTWNMRDDTVQMTLWGTRPDYWPRLGLLGDLLESAGQELVQYRVEGTLAEPKVTAEPLYRLNAALRRLLGEEAER